MYILQPIGASCQTLMTVPSWGLPSWGLALRIWWWTFKRRFCICYFCLYILDHLSFCLEFCKHFLLSFVVQTRKVKLHFYWKCIWLYKVIEYLNMLIEYLIILEFIFTIYYWTINSPGSFKSFLDQLDLPLSTERGLYAWLQL